MPFGRDNQVSGFGQFDEVAQQIQRQQAHPTKTKLIRWLLTLVFLTGLLVTLAVVAMFVSHLRSV